MQLVKQIKSDKLLAENKLVMMSPISLHYNSEYYMQLGCLGNFSKPATPFDLINALKLSSSIKDNLDSNKSLETEKIDASLSPFTVAQSYPWPKNARVLVVDDNQINQLVTSGILEELGLHVEVAADGKDAIKLLKSSVGSQLFDMILMDCQMPIMDGYEASARIRSGDAGEGYIQIPIIALTANTMKKDKEECLAAGMDDYLSKPIDPEDVLIKLKAWLTKEPCQK